MKIVTGSMRRPVTVFMITVAALLFGFVSLTRLPLNLLPDISYPTLTLQTEYADAAPAEVEKLITEPLEEAVSVIQGLRSLRSVSRPGVSEITLEFGWKTAMDFASLDVREKVDMVRLPEDASSPVLLRYDPNLDPILRLGLYGEHDLVTLRHLADRLLKKDLESLEGVASVRVQGGLEEEIQVEVDEDRLAALGLPISAVSTFLGDQNLNTAGGRLRDRDAEFLVRTLNEFEDEGDVARTIVYEDGDRRVTLDDVATVTRGYKEREVVSHVRGQEAVELSLFKEGSANTVQVAQTVKRRLERLRGELPEGTDLVVLADQSTFIEQSLREVRSNAVIGGLLAVLVLYLFLKNRRSTFVIATVIPVSVLGTFFVMQQLGISLNIMSLGGLALGVGMLVDNAIVVLEAISRRRGEGASLWDATREGATEVSRAVTASTLTTVAVFLPIIFVEGIAGQIFRDQALTVAASLLVSLVAALTLIPVLSSLGGRPAGIALPEEPEAVPTPRPVRPRGRVRRVLTWPARPVGWLLRWVGRALFALLPGLLLRVGRWVGAGLSRLLGWIFWPLQRIFDAGWERLDRAYPRLLETALAHRAATLAVAVLLAAAALLCLPFLGLELVPPFAQGQFAFDLEFPAGTPLARAEDKLGEIEDALKDDPRIDVLYASAGDNPSLGGARSERRENVAQLGITVTDAGDRAGEAALIDRCRQILSGYPEIRYSFRRPSYFSFQTPIEVQVYSYDLDGLAAYSDRLAVAMAQIPGLRDVKSSLEQGNPEVQVHFERDRLASLGLDMDTVSRTLRGKIRGDVATRLKEEDRQVDVRVRRAAAQEMNVAEIGGLVVGQVEGRPIPLATVADVNVGTGPAQIVHVGQQRAAVIGANLAGRDLGSATRAIEKLLGDMPPPPSMAATLGGQNRELSTSFRSLMLAVTLAIFMVYLVMASQFESFLHPFVILMTVPLGLVGVVFALLATHTAVSIVVLIGAVMLTGIVVNNAIVLVDFVNQRRREGVPKRRALVEAGAARLRPILMTTLTTVLGLAPMALGLGEGAEIRAPMAVAVIGGLSLATLLTLVVIPVTYDLLDRKA
ncbi:MAG: efflux RND transporter permease subunit [Candidatus Krumholzibacteriia bacterium]|nr:efflux RND transporter permease subunit [Candidatus Latescibacterota bacterium]MCB9516859.1 efflux RND transporter permease subunit [Candidatus Latescibacterota bacterium]